MGKVARTGKGPFFLFLDRGGTPQYDPWNYILEAVTGSLQKIVHGESRFHPP